jgi:hypothetical protein
VWTSLGGKLGIAHGDRDHGDRVTGPLSRYFAATAGPVCGGSLHTLKDIRENYKNAVRDGTWRQWEWRRWRWTRRREAQGWRGPRDGLPQWGILKLRPNFFPHFLQTFS